MLNLTYTYCFGASGSTLSNSGFKVRKPIKLFFNLIYQAVQVERCKEMGLEKFLSF